MVWFGACVVDMKGNMLRSTLTVAFSDPCVLLRCLLSCSSGQPALCVSVVGKRGDLLPSG